MLKKFMIKEQNETPKKLKNYKSKEISKYYVADFETTTQESNYYKKYQRGCLIMWEIQELGNENNVWRGTNMESFEKWLIDIPNNVQIFFHNLTSFDSWVILSWARGHWNNNIVNTDHKISYSFLPVANGNLSITLSIGNKSVYITDSYRLIPLSIYYIGSSLGYEKLTTNYHIDPVDKVEDLPKDYVEYTSRDVSILNKILCLFRETINKINQEMNFNLKWNALTSSAISRQLIETLDEDFSFKISSVSQEHAAKYYRGGFTSFNMKYRNTEISGDFEFWDAKSHYPSIMYLYNLPSGEPIKINENEIENYEIVMVWVEGIIEKPLTDWGTIPINNSEENYIYGENVDFVFRGTLREWKVQEKFYSFKEWKYKEILAWEQTNNYLKEVVGEFYKYKEDKKFGLIYKLIINAMYGSMGMRHNYPELMFLEVGKKAPQSFLRRKKEYMLSCKKEKNYFDNFDTYDYIEISERSKKCWNKWAAAFITSIGRAILQEYIAIDPAKALYCDTDSILAFKDFKGFEVMKQGKQLGDWDIDKKGITSLIYQCAKRYATFSVDNLVKLSWAGIDKGIFENKERENVVSIFHQENIIEGQKRKVLDKYLFPFITNVDYVNNKLRSLNEKEKSW